MTNAIFAYGASHMDLGAGLVADSNGQVSVPTGASGGSNAGAAVLNAIRAGMIPAAPKTTGFNPAVTAATTAIAAIAATPTQAQLVTACNALLASVNALTAA